jgi:uncharacterized protein YjbI with pentapeptide repeats
MRDVEQRLDASQASLPPADHAQQIIDRLEKLEASRQAPADTKRIIGRLEKLEASDKTSTRLQRWTGVISAVVAIVTVGFAGWQLKQGNQQLSNDALRRDADIYAQDVSGLSADLAGTRILAIRDLQQIAEHRQPAKRREVLGLLTDFLQVKAPTSGPACLHDAWYHKPGQTDLTVAFEVIKDVYDRERQQPTGTGMVTLDLSDTCLKFVDLTEWHLSGATLNESDLEGANLTGTDLSCANVGSVFAQGATFDGTNLAGADFTWSVVKGTETMPAVFKNVDLRGARLASTVFEEVTLGPVDDRDADFDPRPGFVDTRTRLNGVDMPKTGFAEKFDARGQAPRCS